MIGAGLPIPIIIFMFSRPDLSSYLLVSPFVYFCVGLAPGAAITALQDFVLPRMYGTVGALFLFSGNIVGAALGPYSAGKIATLSGSLQLGMCAVLVAPAMAVLLFWRVAKIAVDAGHNKTDWAVAAGEAG